MTELLEKIRSRGYWRVIIRPVAYIEDRIEHFPDLFGILLRTSVELRGLGFPNLGSHSSVKRHRNWIQQECSLGQYLEVWRFYQSGQFVDVRGIEGDWADSYIAQPPQPDWAPCRFLVIEDVVDQFTEVFEFASRLAFTDSGDEQMRLHIGLHGIKDRRLTTRDRQSGNPYFKEFSASVLDEYCYDGVLSKAELVAIPRELALKPAEGLLHRFGYSPSSSLLREMQADLFRPYPSAAR